MMKKYFLIPNIVCSLIFLLFNSCSSAKGITMTYGTGEQLGIVTVSVTLTENRATGVITGDTGKYGYFNKMPAALLRELKGNTGSGNLQKKKTNKPTLAEKAYAVAAYDIIQQIKTKGGNAADNVVSQVDKNYDLGTGIETVKIYITANAVNTKKPAKR